MYKTFHLQPIVTAILSFGMSGRVFHAPFIAQHPGFALKGIWERSKSESLMHYPGIHIYRSLEEVLADDTVSLVIVNTPTNTHYEFTKKVLEAGKHAVVEKAFTTTVAEAMELDVLAKEKGLLLSVYQNRRWDSELLTLKKIIVENKVGTPIEAEFHFDRYKPELGAKDHKEKPGPGAGLLNDLGPHLIDQSLHLFGLPDAVYADIQILREGSLVDDYFHITLFYPKFRVQLKSSMLVKEPLPSYILHGTNGSFIKKRADPQEAALLADIKPEGEKWGAENPINYGHLFTESGTETIVSEPGNYGAYYEAIYQSFVNKATVPVPAREAIYSMTIIETARKSNEEKRTIQLNW